MKITIITVGKIKEKFYRDAIDEYVKRLSKYCKLEIKEVQDEKTPDNASETVNLQILAKEGERIRNLAQNELGMLRPERAQHVTIYIQSPDTAQQTLQQNEEPRMEMLDILLGLLDVLHIGE